MTTTSDFRSLDVGLAKLSRAVYERPWDKARDEIQDAGWWLSSTFDHADSEAILCQSAEGGDWALVFRGTEALSFSISDVLANLGKPTRWAGPGWVHSGYLGQLERIRYKARTMAEDVPNPHRLHVCGHSLGGALSVLFAAWVLSDVKWRMRLHSLVTFGAPKSLSKDGCDKISCMKRQYAISLDPAPYWPPSMVFCNPGVEIYLESPSWWPGFMYRHSIDTYIEALEKS